jgi:hypothetical protein
VNSEVEGLRANGSTAKSKPVLSLSKRAQDDRTTLFAMTVVVFARSVVDEACPELVEGQSPDASIEGI